MERKRYLEVKVFSRNYACDKMREKNSHYIEFDIISKEVENIFGYQAEINSLEIILGDEGKLEMKRVDNYYLRYEIERELTKKEMNGLKLENKEKLDAVNKKKEEERKDWEEHNQEQLQQWEDFFNYTAGQKPLSHP